MKIKSLQLFQKHGLRVLFFAMSLLSTSLSFAYDFLVDGIYYDIKNGNEVQVTSRAHTLPNNSYSGDVVIPPTVTYNGKTYSVTAIGRYAFEYAYDLKSISIPNTITYIGMDAFSSSGLTSVNITDLASWCKIDFYYKISTSSGLIENTSNPLSIADHLFLNGTEVTNLVIPNTVTSIGCCAFFGCTGITSVSIPNSVTEIGGWAFYRCSGLTGTLSIPNSVINIGKNAFEYCSGLTGSLTIPNSVISIGESAFAYCSGLTNLSIGNSVTHIGAFAFQNCGSLTILNFNATSCQDFELGYLCPFIGTVISTIEIGNSVQKIPSHFVYGLSTIRTVSIGSSVTSIGNYAFYDCSGLKSVYSIAANPPVMASDYCFYNCDNSATLYVPYDALSTYKNTAYWYFFKNIYGVDAEGNVLVSEISLNKTNIHLNVNQTYKLSAYVTPVVAANKKVNWSSSNSGVATVDTVGLVTAIADGTAIISATTTDGTNLSASCMVTASSIPVSSISLNKTSATLYLNQTVQLTATVSPSNATDRSIVWSTSDNSIASVTSTGLVTAIAPGNAIITASTADGSNLSATCAITVKAYVTSLTLDQSAVTILEGDTITLIPTILPTYATNQSLYWSSNNTSVATVNNGVVVGRAGGGVTITAKTTDGSNLSATCKITVVPNFDISAPNLSHIRGSENNKYDLTIDLANRYDITGMQLDIQFPDGVTIAKDNDGEYDILLDDARKSRNHTATASQIGYNTYRILVSSATANILKDHYGTVLHIMIEIPISHVSGNKQIKYSNIILSEPDETRHTLPTKYSLISYYYLEGDANADVNVDVADYVITGNYILQNSPENFWYDAANVDHNNTIDVNDLTGITNIALGRREGGILQMPAIQTLEDIVLTADPLQIQAGQTKTLNLSLEGNYAFAGFQMDMQLPRGIKLVDASLTDQNSDLSIATAELPDGSIRLLASSFSLKDLVVTNSNFLKLTLMADNSFYGDDIITLDDIKFSERNMVLHTIDGVVIPVGNNVSGLEHIYGKIRIYPEGTNIIIDTPESGTARIITISGITYVREVLPGHNVIPMNDSGFYIVTLNGKTAKLRLK